MPEAKPRRVSTRAIQSCKDSSAYATPYQAPPSYLRRKRSQGIVSPHTHSDVDESPSDTLKPAGSNSLFSPVDGTFDDLQSIINIYEGHLKKAQDKQKKRQPDYISQLKKKANELKQQLDQEASDIHSQSEAYAHQMNQFFNTETKNMNSFYEKYELFLGQCAQKIEQEERDLEAFQQQEQIVHDRVEQALSHIRSQAKQQIQQVTRMAQEKRHQLESDIQTIKLDELACMKSARMGSPNALKQAVKRISQLSGFSKDTENRPFKEATLPSIPKRSPSRRIVPAQQVPVHSSEEPMPVRHQHESVRFPRRAHTIAADSSPHSPHPSYTASSLGPDASVSQKRASMISKRTSRASSIDDDLRGHLPSFKPKFRKRPVETIGIHFIIWLALTIYMGFVIAKGHRKDGFLLAMLIYIFITLRLLAQHISMSQLVYKPIGKVLDSPTRRVSNMVAERWRLWILGIGALGIILGVAVGSAKTSSGSILQRIQSFCGILVFFGILYATSNNRSQIPWKTVVSGLVIQYAVALFVFKTNIGVDLFAFVSRLMTGLLDFSTFGVTFLFGSLVDKNVFVFSVLPAIVFFCSFISIIYYFGGMQYIICKMAWLMVRIMGTSGGESVVGVASPFVGMGESALLVKPFVEYMTKSELHSVMTSGFATISGSVLLAYVNYVKDTSSLLTCCVMSVPCALAVSKLRYPETEESITKGKVKIPDDGEEKEANFLHAAGNGAAMGVQLILLIGGSLLSIVSLFTLADYLIGWAFHMVDVYDTFNGPLVATDSTPLVWVSMKLCLSFLFSPIAWLIGIEFQHCRKAAEFMAMKMVANEFLAYSELSKFAFEEHPGVFDERTIKLLSFALCGFANVASIGIQIGCLGAMAPMRKRDLAKLALSSMLAGTMATWLCAAVSGTLM